MDLPFKCCSIENLNIKHGINLNEIALQELIFIVSADRKAKRKKHTEK